MGYMGRAVEQYQDRCNEYEYQLDQANGMIEYLTEVKSDAREGIEQALARLRAGDLEAAEELLTERLSELR